MGFGNLLLQFLKSAKHLIDLGDKFLLTLHREGLSTALKQSVLLLSSLFEHAHACLLGLLDEGTDVCIVLLEFLLDQFKVLIETVSKFEETLINLSLDLLLEPIGEDLVPLLSVFVAIK